jgi:hypothetical protein
MNDKVRSAEVGFFPEDQAELIRYFTILVAGRPTLAVALLQRCVLSEESDVEVAKACNVLPSTVSAERGSLHSDYYALRDLLQPPHAAD